MNETNNRDRFANFSHSTLRRIRSEILLDFPSRKRLTQRTSFWRIALGARAGPDFQRQHEHLFSQTRLAERPRGSVCFSRGEDRTEFGQAGPLHLLTVKDCRKNRRRLNCGSNDVLARGRKRRRDHRRTLRSLLDANADREGNPEAGEAIAASADVKLTLEDTFGR